MRQDFFKDKVKMIYYLQLGLAKTSKMLTSTSSKKFEVFWGLASKNLNLFSINNPQSFILKLKNSVLIPTSKFEVFEGCHKWGFFKDSSKNLEKYGLFCKNVTK